MFSSAMASRALRNLLCGSRILTFKFNGVMRLSFASYHYSEGFYDEPLPSEWYENAFSKMTELSCSMKDVDLVNGRIISVVDASRIRDETLLENMRLFKSIVRDYIGCPSVQETMKNNIVKALGSNNAECKVPQCFSKSCERTSITLDSLTKVADFLNVSAQQRKVVRAAICPQVTQHQIWTGALEEILNALKPEIVFLSSVSPSKELKMAEQIVTSCLKVLDVAISYNPESNSWMRVVPTKGADSPTPHKWEDILEMFIDLVECLSEETRLAREVKKAEAMKEGLYQIRDVCIDKNIGYRETRHQENLVQKILSKNLGHSSRCLFTLLMYYLYGNIQDIEVDLRGGIYVVGRGDKFRLCMGKILTSDEEKMVWSGVKQLDRALRLFEFVWETAGMKGNLELQGHLWCVGTDSRSLTYRGNTFLLHGIDRFR